MATFLHTVFAPADGYPAPEYLTERDKWAATFESVFEVLADLRSDCPDELPKVWRNPATKVQDGSRILTDLQKELVVMAAGAVGDGSLLDNQSQGLDLWTEAEGYAYCMKKMDELLEASQ
jgi:hypothetical protein